MKSPWDRMSAAQRYHTDPQFAAIVDVLYAHLRESHYTPTELREACHLAACKYEMLTIRPLFIDPKEPFKWNFAETEEKNSVTSKPQ